MATSSNLSPAIKLVFKTTSEFVSGNNPTKDDDTSHTVIEPLPRGFDLLQLRMGLTSVRSQTNSFLTRSIGPDVLDNERMKERKYVTNHRLSKGHDSGSDAGSSSDLEDVMKQPNKGEEAVADKAALN